MWNCRFRRRSPALYCLYDRRPAPETSQPLHRPNGRICGRIGLRGDSAGRDRAHQTADPGCARLRAIRRQARMEPDFCDTLAGLDTTPACGVWGTQLRLSAPHAALANGALVQSFELDDVHRQGVLHVGAVALPPLFAIAEMRGMTGQDFLRAAVAGFEIGPRVGMCMGPQHLVQGWHWGRRSAYSPLPRRHRPRCNSLRRKSCTHSVLRVRRPADLWPPNSGPWSNACMPGARRRVDFTRVCWPNTALPASPMFLKIRMEDFARHFRRQPIVSTVKS